MTTDNRPTLQTTRLVLRPFVLADAKRVQLLAGDVNIAATTANIPHPYLDGMAEQWIGQHAESFRKGQAIQFAMTIKESGTLIGCIDLIDISKTHQRAEIGYWVGYEYWNSGFCSEAMNEVVRYGFENLGLNKIKCRHISTNPASGRVMQKAGLTREGIFKQDMFRNGAFVDMEVYGILKTEFGHRELSKV